MSFGVSKTFGTVPCEFPSLFPLHALSLQLDPL